MQTNLQTFGQRVQQLRTARSMTQEDLAVRLGISPQAVSKWENGASAPEFAILPALVKIFDTDFNYIMGHDGVQAPTTNAAATFEGLPLVHTFENVACYSDKQVATRQGSSVTFADGSSAELSGRMAINNGIGEIRFAQNDEAGDDASEMYSHAQIQSTAQNAAEPAFDLAVCHSVKLELGGVDCKIMCASDNGTRVEIAANDAEFSKKSMRVDDGTLVAQIVRKTGLFGRGRTKSRPVVTIRLPFERGQHGHIHIAGSGTITCDVAHFASGNIAIAGSGRMTVHDFGTVRASIAGSGNLKLGNAGEIDASIAGSGDMHFGDTEKAAISIAGSGDVTANRIGQIASKVAGSGDISVGVLQGGSVKVNGSGDVGIGTLDGGDITLDLSGSGDVKIGGGTCRMFTADLSGAADVDARELTAQKAGITISGAGECVLGHVLESSKEKTSRGGSITILGRGPKN